MASTYNDIYLDARRRLREIGVEADQLEARELICAASGKTRQEFLQGRFYYASQEIEDRMESMIRRRQRGEPVAYILGEWDFYGLTLEVNPDVLIPRGDTEVLAEKGILAARRVKESCRVLDLCTGSGCVGLAIAHEVPGCRVVLADLSDAALQVARRNVRRLGLRERVSCLKADALKAPPEREGTFDVIVCNPPYIRTGDLAGLDISVRSYEPELALDGGGDGLKFYRSITRAWKSLLRPGGTLLFEVGYDQAEQVEELLRSEGYADVTAYPDTADILRVTEGRVTR